MKLPTQPLLDAARRGQPWHDGTFCPFCCGDRASALCVSCSEVGERLGVTPRTVLRWKNGDPVRASSAERYASRLGLVDFEIWPELLDFADGDRLCATCNERFTPRTSVHRFCTVRCRRTHPDRLAYDREKSKRRRLVNAVEVDAYQARYRLENAEMKRRYAASYYRRNRDRMIAADRERKQRRSIEEAA